MRIAYRSDLDPCVRCGAWKWAEHGDILRCDECAREIPWVGLLIESGWRIFGGKVIFHADGSLQYVGDPWPGPV